MSVSGANNESMKILFSKHTIPMCYNATRVNMLTVGVCRQVSGRSYAEAQHKGPTDHDPHKATVLSLLLTSSLS